MLSAYLAIKHFKNIIEGRDITIFTDHKPLTFAFNQKSEKASPRQLRHLELISQFTTNIVYIKGAENTAADALSRICSTWSANSIDFGEIAEAQQNDDELKALLEGSTTLQLHKLTVPGQRNQIFFRFINEQRAHIHTEANA